MNQSELDRLPELMRAHDVREILHIRGNTQWVKFRRMNPEIHRRLPGLKQVRYSKRAVLGILMARTQNT